MCSRGVLSVRRLLTTGKSTDMRHHYDITGYGYDPDAEQPTGWNEPGTPGYFLDVQEVIQPERETVTFAGFTPAQLASTGIISYVIVRALGASVPGAIVMGIGNVLWEAGSLGVPAGWKRYVLGLFRKPE